MKLNLGNVENTYETARKTLRHLGQQGKESGKFDTDHLPTAAWYMVRQAVSLFDRRFLMTSAIIAIMVELPFYVLSALRLSDKVEELAYGLGYVAVALTTLLLKNTFHMRQVMVASLVCIWGLRLSIFLLYRTFHTKDFRLAPIHRNLVTATSFWFYQTLEIWLNSLPVVLVNSFGHNPSIGIVDMVGYLLWIIGFGIETVADYQKFQYKQEHKTHWCNVGLFKYSRHPNYFGEILLWFGIFFMVVPTLRGWTWIALLAPVFHAFVIMFVSGIPPLERKYNEQWGNNPEYQRYKEHVPILIPAMPSNEIRQVMKKLE